MCQFVANSEPLEHIARLETGAGARATGTASDVLHAHHQAFALNEPEGNVGDVWKALLCMAVDLSDFNTARKFGFQLAAELYDAFAFVFHLVLAEFAGLTKANDSGDIQRARAHPALMSAAVNDCFQANARLATPNEQGAHALWSIDLVTTPTE